ncbi:OmpA family protein [Runella slithyformis]|uniref:OmpA/MotB domain protein n=1 Tax=Runella slithyformis (strain ATCC 29530 / DSM 19594 / LMG 11500 / NCIMB 11436 / LSU 4) TaxID=761193 RepID=A0A7U4E8H2_RUNSL|nr:OmpA family protein [Runella slithyformis]AEI51701.1 OmpA/MotB domain protein [Runella slithyformis DSM 19594]
MASGVKMLAWILLVGWMGGSAYWHVCKIKLLCDGPVEAGPPTAAAYTIPALNIADGNSLNLSSAMNFGFKKSMPEPNYANVKKELDSLAAYLKANATRKLTITGLYSSIEQNTGSFADLGLARAEALKEYLVQAGVPGGQLTTASKLVELIFSTEDSTHGMEFGFDSLLIPKTEEALAAAEKYENLFKPMDLYFKTAKADYIKTPENEKFITEAVRYLTANTDKKLSLTGHTDNDGTDVTNIKLSKNRANSIKALLIQRGIAESQLVTDAKGESQPKATNDTPEGRKANRRVSIIVQ